MGEPYKTQLKPEVKPVSLLTPRQVLIPIHEQVIKESNMMESISIIFRVDTGVQAWLWYQSPMGPKGFV